MKQIGKYKIIGPPLGQGGFGAVYLGEDQVGQVAIKVFRPQDDIVAGLATSATSDPVGVLKERFLSEAKTLRSLSENAYVVQCYEFSELEDGTPYYVMPYLSKSLADEIGKDAFTKGAQAELDPALRPRPLPLGRANEILDQVLQALKAVHAAGMVHRDIKPANILFSANGNVQLCDFGIAKLPDNDRSQTGVGMGSRNYMSPEQRESAKHVEASSDIYSIAVVAYRMITGTLPQGGKPPIAFVPGMGEPLSDLIMQALEFDADDRPRDGGDFLDRFRTAIESTDSVAESEATGTWIKAENSTIRDELKPLQQQILKVLCEKAIVNEASRELFDALASVVDLDKAGLDALIENAENELGPSLALKRNFCKLLEDTLRNGDLTTARREMLHAAAAPTGWGTEEINTLIDGRQTTTTNPQEKSQAGVELESTEVESAEVKGALIESIEVASVSEPPADAKPSNPVNLSDKSNDEQSSTPGVAAKHAKRKLPLLAGVGALIVVIGGAAMFYLQERRNADQNDAYLVASAQQAAPRTTQSGGNFDVLANQQSQEAQEVQRETRAREFAQNRSQQETKTRQLKSEILREERRSAQIESQFENNNVKIAELQLVFKNRMGSLAEFMPLLQSVSAQTAEDFKRSLVSVEYPGRAIWLEEFSSQMAKGSRLFMIEEIEKLWFDLQREMTESAKISNFTATVSAADGRASNVSVTRIGAFNIIGGNRYLKYDEGSQDLLAPASQPSSDIIKTATDLANFSGGGIVEFALEMTRANFTSNQ